MSGFKNDGLQVQEYLYDFSEDGGAAGAIDLSAKDGYNPLPDGAIVSEVVALVEEAIVGTSSTLAWGNTSDPDGYSGAAIAEASLGADVVRNGFDNGAALLWDDTNDHKVHYLANAANERDFSVTIGVADLTAGKVRFMVSYYLPGRDA